jgi:carbon storage regulator
MLCLSRKLNEEIVIGDGGDRITIKVIEIQKDRVRLGIEAPREVPVRRAELIRKEKLT